MYVTNTNYLVLSCKILYIWQIYFSNRYHLDTKFLYVANMIEGVGGSFSVIFLCVYSITADINESKSSRVFWINVLDCLNQILISAFTVGIGVIVDHVGFVEVYIVCIVPVGISILAVFFFLSETCPKKESHNLNIIVNVGRVVGLYTSQGSKRHRMTLFLCLVTFSFAAINFFDVNSLNALFLMQQPFCWDATQISLYAAVNGAIAAVGGLIFMSVRSFYNSLLYFPSHGVQSMAFSNHTWLFPITHGLFLLTFKRRK